MSIIVLLLPAFKRKYKKISNKKAWSNNVLSPCPNKRNANVLIY